MKKRYFAGAAVAAMILTAGMATTSFADWSQQNGKWYYYNDNNGRLVRNDWVCSKDAWYYMDYNGVMQTNSLIDDTYYVNENGVMITNAWKYINNSRWNESGWRYFGANGKAYTNGWKQINDVWYHFTDSVMDIGWVEIDGKIYHLEDSGTMTTGWRKLADREDDWGEYWYYFNSSGKLIYDGELKISGETYIFDHSGRMLTGWVNESDYTSTGRDDLSNSDVNALRYFRSGGQQMNGWRYMASPDDAEENWYYFKDGRAYSTSYKTTEACGYGIAKIKGETYCFDKKGRMKTGLVELSDGRKFYFDSDGKMKTGRIVVNDDNHDNEVFYFTTSGSIGKRGDGFTGVKDGSLYENGRLVSAEEGMKYEKVTVDGKTYVVNESGKVKTSRTVTDADGVKYKITKDPNGGYHVEVSW